MAHIHFSWLYPVDPHTLFKVVTRLDHLERKAEYLGHRGHKMLELREREGVFRSVTRRRVDIEVPWWFLPGKLIPSSRITQHQLWGPPDYAGNRRYAARVELQRVPASVTGEGRLISVDYTSTRYEIDLDIVGTLPLTRRSVEQRVCEQMTEAIDGEHEFRLLWLDQRREHAF